MKVYHGSSNKNLKFNPKKPLMFFTTSKEDARGWAERLILGGKKNTGSYIYTAELNFKNLYERGDDFNPEYAEYENHEAKDEIWDEIFFEDIDEKREELVKAGFDCFHIELGDGLEYYIVPYECRNIIKWIDKETLNENTDILIEEGTTGAIGTDYCLLNGKYKNINESLNKLIDAVLDESLEKYDDFYATNSEYEFLAFMKRAKTGYRVLYDIKNKYYFMAEATSCVHPDLLKKAVQNGYYPELTITTYWDYFLTELGMSLMDFLFFPLNMDNKQLTQDRVSDGHTYKYTYDFGIFWVHYTSSLEPCSVYDLIGEPKEFEEIFPEGFGERLNEHLEKMGDCFITKSPYDIVNLFKNKPKEYRVLYDKNIDMYMIGDAESVTHYDMVQKAYKDAYYYNMEDFIQDLGGTIDNYTEMGQSGYWDGEDDENFDAYLWYIVFSPNEEWELGTDGYDKRYDYPFGHVFTRGCDLSEIGLWDALGVPQNSEKLNESTELNDDFWKWFGNSKVVDSQGNPLVVYHGTKVDNIKVFKLNNTDKYPAIYFTDSYEVASTYAWAKPMRCYLRIEKPLIVDGERKGYYDGARDIIVDSLEKATKGSYDGVIINNLDDDAIQDGEGEIATTYIVFSPKQIKSVDNKGIWSNSDNIYESLNREIERYL